MKYLSIIFPLILAVAVFSACEKRVVLPTSQLAGSYENSTGSIVKLNVDGTASLAGGEGYESGSWIPQENYVYMKSCVREEKSLKCTGGRLETNFSVFKINGKIILRISDDREDQFVKK